MFEFMTGKIQERTTQSSRKKAKRGQFHKSKKRKLMFRNFFRV
jgi:hypothetical protein